MKDWLTLGYVKAHSRIDFDCDDPMLEIYVRSAERALLNYIRRSYDEVLEKWGGDQGEFPEDLMHATLMLVDHSYTQRSPADARQMYAVPYTFDFLVKPYIKLS